ncbi:type II toxin-antitoxin system RelE/ParE family toxin [Desulfobacterota bacterium AH_259_B03_O07]|nr:type II toxin-antitoxin system RelE/ParE family toxin [Desulfobacterota bacterium AH_259_B03_O07]
MVKVEWTEEAIQDLEKLDKPIVKRILNKISWFSLNFDNLTPEPLSADLTGTFKLRITDWRIIYTLE